MSASMSCSDTSCRDCAKSTGPVDEDMSVLEILLNIFASRAGWM